MAGATQNAGFGKWVAVAALAATLSACGDDSGTVGVDGSSAPSHRRVEVGAPSISGAPSTIVQVGETYVFQPEASDKEGDPLSFEAQGLPAWAAIDRLTGRVTGAPTDTDVGETAQITVAVSDGERRGILEPFRIRIRSRTAEATQMFAGTAKPVISGQPATLVQVGAAYLFQPQASDADSPRLKYSISNKPVWASFSEATGRLSGTPAAANVGTAGNITIRVTDGASTVGLPPFAITVQTQVAAVATPPAVTPQPATPPAATPPPAGTSTPANSAPVIGGSPATTAAVGQAYSFQPSASDPDAGTMLGFSIANKPAWAAFNTATGALTGTPTAAGSTAGIVITVSDGKASASLPAFGLSVSGSASPPAVANAAPSISGAPATTATVGNAYAFQPSAQDANGDKLTFAIQNKPAWASFDAATGALSGSPAATYAGSYAGITISVTDGKTTTSLAPFAINVVALANGSVELSWMPPTANVDGSALSLGGYRLYYGPSQGSMTKRVDIAPGLTSYVLGSLASGTHYFGMTAVSSAGVESEMSNIGSKTL